MRHEKPFLSYLLSRVVVQTVLVLAIVVFGFLLVDNYVVRWDLTEDRRFSISDASHELAASLEDPLTIRAYFSDNIPERIQPFQRQVFDILSEYEAHGGGRIKIERHDPNESSAAASEASNYGVRPIELHVYGATEASALQVYGSIVLIYRDKSSEVINIAERYPQGFEGLSVLEYEISSKIWELTHDKPKLGLTGHLERPGGRPGMPPQFGGGQPRPEFTQLRRMLGEAFEVEELDLDQEEPDPETVPLLLVVRPREFSDVAVFRLDQYLMKGGRVLMFVTQGLIDETPWGQRQFTYTPFKTGLDGWLEHQGLRVPNEFVCQLGNAIPIRIETVQDLGFGPMKVIVPAANWFWPVFGAEDAIDRNNPATQTLKSVALLWPHPVDILSNKLGDKTASTLVRSHENESWRWKETARIDRRHLGRADAPSPSDFTSSAVAVALEGTFRSYFADKPVPPSLTRAPDEEEAPADDDAAGDEKDEAGGGEEEEGEKEAEEAGDEEEAEEAGEEEAEEAGEEEAEEAGEEEAEEAGEEEKADEAEEEEGSEEAGEEEGSEEAGEEGGTEQRGDEEEAEASKPAKGPDVVEASREPTQLVVVGNAFFISDLWLDPRQADRVLLALNLVDWLARSKALIALRAKRYANRALIDEDYKKDLESLRQRFDEGEMDETTFSTEVDRARDRQKARWNRSRGLNILVPCFLVLFGGAVVWILRAAARGRVSVPVSVPPESLRHGE
ncbi:MAG: Gldg family protein [Planctomycetota bacterium]|jgi:ABC-type uncharacterized transport system involved in gliding motility auxiliary subunit